nr:amino acid transporter [Kibdelosporangium sp. MJ126-NF4]
MTVGGAAFLGIGSMVGAGIFALLGEAGAIAGSAAWLSFLLAGVIALLQGYAVAKLGARYPSSGGIVTYLHKGFGRSHITSVVSWLLYFAALIVTAMVAVSFGHYGSALLFGGSPGWAKALTTVVVVAAAVVNIAGAKSIERLQTAIVVVMLAVLAVFIAVTFANLDPGLLAPSSYPSATHIVSSVALTFFAYLGFAVVSFTGGELRDPARALPRAMYLSLGITTLLYVLIAIGVFGTLTVPQVIENGETALAVAAEPSLGTAGFVLVTIVAMLGTSSSVNANLFAAMGSTAELAGSGTFPKVFGSRARVGGTRGLVISVVVALLMANLIDLTAIASLGSAVALVIFLVTSVAAFRLRAQTRSRTWPLIVGIVLTAGVLVVFGVQTARTEPATLVAMIAVFALAVGVDLVWRVIRPTHP